MTSDLIVTLIKPSKYDHEGFVDRFRIGYMPNATPWHIASMTPKSLRAGDIRVSVRVVDEMIEDNLSYLKFERKSGTQHLVVLCGVQSHQFQRACDIASSAVDQGALAVIGGPHTMTCDTSEFHGNGVSFSLAEAELVWQQILTDAAFERVLQPVYGADKRWQENLDSHVLQPPSKEHLKRYPVPLMGIYPQRGCPYNCNFCSVIQISGHAVRGQKTETIIESLRLAKKAGIRFIIFTSDNFNKYDKVIELLDAMIAEGNKIPFWL